METLRHSERSLASDLVGRFALVSAAHAVIVHFAAKNQIVTDADGLAVVHRIARLFNVQPKQLFTLLQNIAKFPPCERAHGSATLPVPSASLNPNDSVSADAQPSAPRKFVFHRNGQVMQVRFSGATEFILRPCKGTAYLNILLANPRKGFAVVDLVYEVAKLPQKYALGSAGEGTDEDALVAYREKYRELAEEMQKAKANNDAAQHDRIHCEMEWLAKHVKKDVGFGGRLRKQADDHERLRKSFRAAIRRVVKEIAKYDTALAAHLTSPRLICGNFPRYDPPDGIEWDT